jgi:hypothetical protein
MRSGKPGERQLRLGRAAGRPAVVSGKNVHYNAAGAGRIFLV